MCANCRTCGGPISDSLRGDGVYCSQICRNKWHRELPGKVEERRDAYRQAAGLVVHASCIQCGKPLLDGSNARRKVLLGRLQYSELPSPQGERSRQRTVP